MQNVNRARKIERIIKRRGRFQSPTTDAPLSDAFGERSDQVSLGGAAALAKLQLCLEAADCLITLAHDERDENLADRDGRPMVVSLPFMLRGLEVIDVRVGNRGSEGREDVDGVLLATRRIVCKQSVGMIRSGRVSHSRGDSNARIAWGTRKSCVRWHATQGVRERLTGAAARARLEPAPSGMSLAAGNGMSDIPQYVADVMTRKVMTLERNETLRTADDVMRLGRIRHLPIVDTDGSLAGIVSQRDLFHSGLVRALGFGSHAREQALDALAVKEAMKTEVLTTTPNTLLTEAAKVMLERKVGCLVVLDANKIAGILTESDFVRLVAGA